MDGVSRPRVAVGSLNAAKLRAVEEVVARLFPGARVEGVAVGSGVGEQPRGDEETLRGADARARNARLAVDAHLGVGIESGVERHAEGLYVFTWVAVCDAAGVAGRACTARLQLPPSVAASVERGAPLERAMASAAGAAAELGRHGGAMGHLTGGAVTRTHAIVQALHFAFAPLTRPEHYER